MLVAQNLAMSVIAVKNLLELEQNEEEIATKDLKKIVRYCDKVNFIFTFNSYG